MGLRYKHLFFVVMFILFAVIPASPQTGLPEPLFTPNSGAVPTDAWLVVVQPSTNPDVIAAQLGYENIGSVDGFPNTYLFRVSNSGISSQAAQRASQAFALNSQIMQFSQQVAYQQFSRDPSNDPLNDQPDPFQWHLFPGVSRVPPWLNINVQPAWSAGFIGTGVQIAIVDDGLQYTHRDLAPNYLAAGSYDFNGNDSNPAPVTIGDCDTTANCHGTAVAGVAAAADNPMTGGEFIDRDFCGVGVAYGANISGIRLTAAPSTDLMESNALKYMNGVGGNTTSTNDIYVASWGPPDDGATLRGPGPLTRAAIADSIANGRGGLGTIYVWAGGDGRAYYSGPNFLTFLRDNVNADGYANSRYVIAVAAAGSAGASTYYSEDGAPLLVTAPSSDETNGIATTDLMGAVGYEGYSATDDCTLKLGGTSAAAPMVAGIVALMLQANPTLTWRDVQHILVQTAFKPDYFDSSWETNAAGHHNSPRYGFGVVDASAAVALAQSWTNVAPEISYSSPVITVNRPIPPNGNGISSSVVVPANIKVEHVEVIFNAAHQWRGDIEVNLTAPSGTVSQLMNTRPRDGYLYWPTTTVTDPNYTNWKFSTVRDWDEYGGGTWTLNVVDRKPLKDNGTFQNWQIVVYGTQTTPLAPLPLTPTAGADLKTNLPVPPVTFTWNNNTVFQADHLELQVTDTASLVVRTMNIPGSPKTLVVNLPVESYSWQIRTVASVGGTSAWSQPQTFSLSTKPNVAPVRNINTDGTVTLTWSQVTWAARYEIEIDDSAAFTSPLSPTTFVSGSMVATTIPLNAGLWYWHIRPCGSLTTCTGAWSATETIVVTS